MAEDDSTVKGAAHNTVADRVRVAVAPVHRVDGPVHRRPPDLLQNTGIIISVRRTEDIGKILAQDVIQGVVRRAELTGDLVVVFGGKLDVIVCMLGDLMSLAVGAAYRIGVSTCALSQDEKRDLYIAFRQPVQQPSRVIAGPVVKGQGNQLPALRCRRRRWQEGQQAAERQKYRQ